MSLAPEEIADTLRDSVESNLLLEKSIYYRVQRDCISAADHSTPLGRQVLLEAARLANAMAHELEDDAIRADHLVLWQRYASELQIAIRLASSELGHADVLDRLAECANVIMPPRNGLG